MKKFIITAFLLLIFIVNKMEAQINLDTIISTNGFGYFFYPVQISNEETKYLLTDTISNTFSLYNMDFSPFIQNINVPEPFAPTIKAYLIIYISRSLFDCDTSNIEYAYAAQSGLNNRTFYIMRTDGTQLLRLDSAIAPYCFGCLNGSDEVRPIRNTSSGAKLFLYYPSNTNNLHIYSLCGELPQVDNISSYFPDNSPVVKLFPNPASDALIFQIDLPDNQTDYEIVIIDSNAKEKKREKINRGSNKYVFDVRNFTSGTYFYSLCTKSRAFQSGKFIITK